MPAQSTEVLDFTRPPLVEVALDVQFTTLSRLRGPQLGLLWARIRDRFPSVEEQNVLAPLPMETFGSNAAQEPRIELTLLDAPPVPRMWYKNNLGNELIQVQQDRFIANWRKVNDEAEYPHYDHVLAMFKEEFEQFRSFVNTEGLGEIVPNQCAVTYFNLIVSGDGWERHGQLHEIFSL